jgi:hypothetical protein
MPKSNREPDIVQDSPNHVFPTPLFAQDTALSKVLLHSGTESRRQPLLLCGLLGFLDRLEVVL